jgi:cytochrome P450
MEFSLTLPPPLVVVVVVVVFFTLLLQLPRYLRRREPRKQPRAHDLKVYPLLGTLPHLVRNRHRFLEWSTGVLQRSPTYTFSFEAVGFGGGVITANPANVEHFLKTNFSNYPKGEVTVSMVEDLLGGGILNSDGDRWLRQRKAASHEFSTNSLRGFVGDTIRSEAAERLLPLLARAARDGRVLDVQDVLQRFAFDSICRVAFGEDPACLSDDVDAGEEAATAEFMRAFDDALSAVKARLMSRPRSLWRVRKLLNTESERRMRAAAGEIRAYAARIVRDRRAGVEAGRVRGDDLLSRFAAAGGEHGDESLRDVVTNFILAGRDTTSSALTWFFWLVSGRPDVEDRIVREIRAVRASSASAGAGTTTAPFSLDELRGMHYLHAAITESMRLYPPAALNTRRCERGEFLPDGTFVGAGWQVSYSAYAMARMVAVWGGDCEEFRPERWLDGGGVFRPASPFKYPVFHAGPRTCLGREMAYVQMKSIAAYVLERFTLRFAGDEGPPVIELAVTLRMKGGLPMQVKERMG